MILTVSGTHLKEDVQYSKIRGCMILEGKDTHDSHMHTNAP